MRSLHAESAERHGHSGSRSNIVDSVDRERVADRVLDDSRYGNCQRLPKDLPAFCAKLVEEIAEGRHAGQAASA